ncbi:CopD family protein [Bradyrhizobium sp. WSM1253]|uniref:CopD family protein n=1 Tax=Bradyrhizobium sp. WSM1253 TaxID=319003 RepID=UPI0002D4294A|nr:CopD family protein [Bradyrhizobium sp. WSM1253]
MLKLAHFVFMLAFAAVNRLRLTPQLATSVGSEAQSEALHHLTRNSAIEIVLGFAIVALVGMLGALHPAIHLTILQQRTL